MKRPLAYLTAAWSGEPDVDMELAAHYCRLTYEAGFSPICPLLYLPLFLNDSVPEEHKAGIDMRRDMLRRSHTLIVCGSAVDEDVKNDIAVAGRLGIAATTLEGVLAVKGHGTPGQAGQYAGSLFDGIGVFPLAASRCGIRPVWASEIEKAPISITKRHFPDMVHLGDITKVDGGKIPPVHIITFGSPCQNLSLIGNRSGLAGAKSSLFYQAFRIIQEMRDATDNLYPAIAVWENVMGAFYTNDRMDFRAVLSAFSDTEVPMPPSGRWGNAGMVRGGTPDVCWRLMDAQYWAGSRRLARRQRIFVVADFGGRRAADILFKPRPMLPLPPPCGEGGRAAAEGDRTASFETGRQIPVIHPFQCFRMRGAAKRQEETAFRNSFGLPTDPFPTLLASDVTPFAFWYEGDPEGGCIRFLTETESERLMGLPEGWTKYGADGVEIRPLQRYKALGNAIALPCADYIMAGIYEVLADRAGKEE